MTAPHDELARLLGAARRVLAFTGAGLSTGSGIPDFRGPQGIWKKRQPVYYDDFLASEAKRFEYWAYKAEGFEAFSGASPNAAHRALVELERLGRLERLVTQNIDGLHQAAGSSPEKLVEVHGTNRWVECVQCKRLSEPGPAVERFRREQRAPSCDCGGWLKFATISFGQAMNQAVMRRAFDAAESCDFVMSLGSTLSVYPAASVPEMAARRGIPYAIVNQGETDQDSLATLRIEGDVVAVLPPAVETLR